MVYFNNKLKKVFCFFLEYAQKSIHILVVPVNNDYLHICALYPTLTVDYHAVSFSYNDQILLKTT